MVLAYTAGSFIMFPRVVITLSAVVAFGPWLAFFYAMTGNVIAASVGYLAGRAAPEGA